MADIKKTLRTPPSQPGVDESGAPAGTPGSTPISTPTTSSTGFMSSTMTTSTATTATTTTLLVPTTPVPTFQQQPVEIPTMAYKFKDQVLTQAQIQNILTNALNYGHMEFMMEPNVFQQIGVGLLSQSQNYLQQQQLLQQQQRKGPAPTSSASSASSASPSPSSASGPSGHSLLSDSTLTTNQGLLDNEKNCNECEKITENNSIFETPNLESFLEKSSMNYSVNFSTPKTPFVIPILPLTSFQHGKHVELTSFPVDELCLGGALFMSSPMETFTEEPSGLTRLTLPV